MNEQHVLFNTAETIIIIIISVCIYMHTLKLIQTLTIVFRTNRNESPPYLYHFSRKERKNFLEPDVESPSTCPHTHPSAICHRSSKRSPRELYQWRGPPPSRLLRSGGRSSGRTTEGGARSRWGSRSFSSEGESSGWGGLTGGGAARQRIWFRIRGSRRWN